MRWMMMLFLLILPMTAIAAETSGSASPTPQVPMSLTSAGDEIESLKRRISELERKSAPTRQIRGNELNPRITAFGDFVGRVDNRPVVNEGGREVSDRFNMREVELDLRADVDPYAQAVLITAIAQEDPLQATTIAIEEGYVNFTRVPRGVSLKAGSFKSGFGILNRLHQHDLPQTTLPLPIMGFLGEEGLSGMGVAAGYVKPVGSKGRTLSLEGEVMNGENTTLFGGVASRDPAYMVRGKLFTDIDDESFLEVGNSLLVGKSVTNNVHTSSRLAGADFLYNWRPVKPRGLYSLVSQGEFFYMNRRDPDTATPVQTERRNAWGAYGLVQIQPYKRWYVGARYDVAQVLADKSRVDRKIGTYVSFYTTEFLRLRLGYEYQNVAGPALGGTPGADLSTIYGQITFVFGSHPAEPYWFNK